MVELRRNPALLEECKRIVKEKVESRTIKRSHTNMFLGKAMYLAHNSVGWKDKEKPRRFAWRIGQEQNWHIVKQLPAALTSSLDY